MLLLLFFFYSGYFSTFKSTSFNLCEPNIIINSYFQEWRNKNPTASQLPNRAIYKKAQCPEIAVTWGAIPSSITEHDVWWCTHAT